MPELLDLLRPLELRDPRQECALGDHHGGPCIREDVLELRAPTRRIDRDEHRAAPRAGEEALKDLPPIFGHESDAVAALDARRGERSGEAGSGAGQVPVAQREVPDTERGSVPAALSLQLDEPLKRAIRGREADSAHRQRILRR